MHDVVIDACCLINLHAAEILCPSADSSLQGICSCLDFHFHMPEIVSQEALYLRRITEGEIHPIKETIDLSVYESEGIVHLYVIENEIETQRWVQYAMQVDDGEAACLAIAQSRRWMLATDDRKASRIAAENGVTVVSTPQIVQDWANITNADNHILREIIQRIENNASYRPRKASPYYSWWMKFVDLDC